MKILNEYPPFYDKIITVFPEVAEMKYVLFTYGDTLYNPAGSDIPPYTIAHEEIHEWQQAEIGKDKWWERYLEDPVFRLDQDLPAFRAEYKAFCKIYKDKNERNSFLRFQSIMLSSALYGNLLSMNEAMGKITI